MKGKNNKKYLYFENKYLFSCIYQNYSVTLHSERKLKQKPKTQDPEGQLIMEANEVRIVNAIQDQEKVYFHMKNGKTVVRYMEAFEIIKANTIGHREGKDARIAEYVRLFNEKYSEPQKITYVKLSPGEERYFELYNKSKVIPLTPEEEEELKELEDIDVL